MQCRIDGIELKPVCIIQLANALELVSRAYTPQAAFHVEEDTAALHRNLCYERNDGVAEQ